MPAPFGPLRLIVNPRSGNGQIARLVPQLTAALDERGQPYDVVWTAGKDDAGRQARKALDEGVRYLVAAGGDGTVHEVLNGMFEGERPVAPDAVLGVFGAGTGCDTARTYGLDRPPEVVAAHLAGPNTMDIDVGVAEYLDLEGRPAQRLFINVAQVGYGAEVVRFADRLPRRLGRVRYLLAAWAGIRAVTRQETTLHLPHASPTVPLVDLVVANGQFFGGGMKVAPRALPDDGKLSVLAFTGQRSQVFQLTVKLYQGEHLPHPSISEWQVATVALEPTRPLRVEADGELLGTTPASFRLRHRALRLKI